MAASKSKRFFGCHVSVSGGLEQGIVNGSTLGVNTIQIHPTPPQRWNTKPLDARSVERFISARKGSGIEKVFFHAVYLINLANPDKQKFHLSKLSLVNYLELAQQVDAEGVIFHVGSNKDQPSEEAGFERAAQGVNWVLEHADNDRRLLLEVAAGSGAIIGDKVEELAFIYDRVDRKERVGFALDTQHMWASGYDFAGRLDQIVSQLDRVLGREKIWAMHLNDSKSALASRKDRHENIGDGSLGLEVLGQIVNHRQLRDLPVILETPAVKDLETAAPEVEKLRRLLGL